MLFSCSYSYNITLGQTDKDKIEKIQLLRYVYIHFWTRQATVNQSIIQLNYINCFVTF